MNSVLLANIHKISVMLFLLTYFIKTILLFTNSPKLDRYSHLTRVPEMVISFLFMGTGVWLMVMLGGIKVFQIIKLTLVFISIPLAIVGFKKKRKTLALISFLFIIGAYGLAEMGKNKPFIPAKVEVINLDSTSAAVHGEKVFLANCVFCHGTDGKKQYRGASDLSKSTLTVESIEGMIREGSKGKMPAYGNILPEEQVAAVATFIVELRTGEMRSQIK